MTVVSAVEKSVSVTAKVRLQNGVNLGTVQELFLRDFTDYLRSGAFEISYVSLARTGNLLLGVTGVEDFVELKLNGQMRNIELDEKEIAVAGTVILEVMQ